MRLSVEFFRAAVMAVSVSFFSTPLKASDPWTRSDVARQIVLTATLAADWGQTLDIERHGGWRKETNPLLGEHPKRGRINAYFLACIAASWVIVDFLPQQWRMPVQIAIMAFQGGVIKANHSLGLRIKF